MSQEIEALQNQQKSMEEEIKALQGQQKSMQEEIEALQARLALMQDAKTSLNEDSPAQEASSRNPDTLSKEELEALLNRTRFTPEELRLYQAGFKVALNFFFHRAKKDENYSALAHIGKFSENTVFQQATNMKFGEGSGTTTLCPPGKCPDGAGGCKPCEFEFAFNGRYFTGA